MTLISMKSLLETGVHFGHRTQKWHPKMKPYIFTERNGIHIIDLQQTVTLLEQAYNVVRDTVARGGIVLFLGTKRQAQEAIQKEAERCGMPYVNQRWLGGTLTNWKTIKEQINELKRLEEDKASGKFERLTKKENLMIDRRVTKLLDRLGGIRSLTRPPDLLYIVDVRREATAVHEANILNIPIVALVDTNCDPSGVDYVIPANDDAIRAIKLMTARIADAVIEGLNLRKDAPLPVEESAEQYGEPEQADEDLLGPATLAKMGSGELEFLDEDTLSEEITE
ncbi:MAG: 30S ribosomal protein S2 [Anaerolineales bacterium]|nr:30S ribosomal protein S2 [Anaerolineales bacterium]